jgi:putative spermidine/putrescine transport system permease protein
VSRRGLGGTVGRTLLLLGLLLPFVPLVLWAFAGAWRYPALLPTEWSGRAVGLLVDPRTRVLEGLRNSLVIATAVSGIAGIIGLSAGRALGLYTFRGKRVVQFLVLAPVVVPALAVTLGIHVLFIRYGLADSVTGVVIAHLIPTTPYVTLVMASVYANYDVAYEQQARVLGAGPVAVLRHVTLPLVTPGLAVACLFAFLISWGEYILTLLIGGAAVPTLPILLFSFLRANDTALAAALSLVLIGPPLVLLVLTSRFLTGAQRAAIGFGRL